MKIMGSTVRVISKNIFDSYGYYYFDGPSQYRKQSIHFAARLIRQIKRKPKSIFQKVINKIK